MQRVRVVRRRESRVELALKSKIISLDFQDRSASLANNWNFFGCKASSETRNSEFQVSL